MSENRCEDCPNVGQCDGCKLRDCETKLYDMTVERDDLQGTLNLIEHMQEGENLRYTIRAAEAKAEQIDERTLLSVRACSNLSNEQLRTAADARTDGLFKFKQKCEAEAKSLREALVVAEDLGGAGGGHGGQ